MKTLNTKQLYVMPPTPPAPPTPMAIPVQFAKPLSYEFRVAENVDKDGKVLSVKLQVQVVEHDEYGVGTLVNAWADVPRYKFCDGVMVV